jgi:hypothetical protein
VKVWNPEEVGTNSNQISGLAFQSNDVPAHIASSGSGKLGVAESVEK